MAEQTQTFLFPADQFLGFFSVLGVLQEDYKAQRVRNVFLWTLWLIGKCLSCVNAKTFCTCVESTPSRPSLHSSFSRFLMSGLAALMSILRLEVGVQGSTEPTSRPFLGVVRGPMVCWFSADTAHWPDDVFFGVFTGSWGATKPSS